MAKLDGMQALVPMQLSLLGQCRMRHPQHCWNCLAYVCMPRVMLAPPAQVNSILQLLAEYGQLTNAHLDQLWSVTEQEGTYEGVKAHVYEGLADLVCDFKPDQVSTRRFVTGVWRIARRPLVSTGGEQHPGSPCQHFFAGRTHGLAQQTALHGPLRCLRVEAHCPRAHKASFSPQHTRTFPLLLIGRLPVHQDGSAPRAQRAGHH